MELYWSHTSSQRFRNCKRTIWYKKSYSNNRKYLANQRVISPFSLLGIVVHETLEKVLNRFIGKHIVTDFRISNSSLFSVGEELFLEKLSLVDWTGIDDRNQLIDWVRRNLKKNLRNAKSLLNTNARGYRILEVETKWIHQIEDGYKLILLPDLILQSPEKEIFVVDWKTQKDIKSDVNNPQLGVYKLLAEIKYGVEDIQTVIAYTERIQWSKPWYSPIFTTDLQNYIIEEISNWKSDKIEDYPANPHPVNCSSCPYITKCDVSLVPEEIYLE